MIRNDIEEGGPRPGRARDRIIDWLVAQGALLLSIYLCGGVTLIAFLVDVLG